MKRRAFCGAVAVIAMIALVGASSSLSAGSRSAAVEHAGASYNVWFVDGFSFVPAWQKMEKQFKAEAAKLGDKATVVGMSSAEDVRDDRVQLGVADLAA